jgi:gamma-glutamyl:cysteine ligase YbdK (ATP-grasp superfamily)
LAQAGDLSRSSVTTIIVEDMKIVARANLIFGLHVHIGVEDRETAIQLMNAARYFVPHMLALSTNSPFWLGMETGLKSYRCKVFDKFPRTNIPDYFPKLGRVSKLRRTCWSDQLHRQRQENLVGHPPASHFQTLEFRCCDIPMRADETIAIAALIQATVAKLYKLHEANQGLPSLSPRADHGKQVARRALRAGRQADRLRKTHGGSDARSGGGISAPWSTTSSTSWDRAREMNYIRRIVENGIGRGPPASRFQGHRRFEKSGGLHHRGDRIVGLSESDHAQGSSRAIRI